MDGVDRTMRRPSLKERLGLRGLGCCGATWGLGPTTVSVRDEEEEDAGPLSPQVEVVNVVQNPTENGPALPCVVQSPAATGMNLAAALAAERQLRAVLDSENGGAIISPSPLRPNSNDERSPTPVTGRNAPGTPSRVSLMRLLEETDGYDGEMKKEEDGGGCDSVCCVCMGRKKGAAFIPCGHTFCRVCSRELWLNRGSCPLCNRSILEILDIY
ncbi:putative E3 ubiquitin ligase [Handroanthus impetiginosus]|uniref:Putative E3 ubiquitin ligase n=1 Tax=Handroanthus impetiginosus TaxID=429701 RepID=A0A2G9GM08_9LAMI|nr:putative E3 ubiquitin ligase [Handroanthus impetiginosus]